MKRFTLMSVCLGILFTLTANVTTVQAQQDAAAQKRTVGLIDMAHLFKEYTKFKDLRDQLRNEIKASDEKAKQMGEQIQALQKTIKDGTYAEGSAEYQKIESQLIAQSTQFEAFRKTQQQKFLRRESQIYKDVYLEVVDAVNQFATYYNYEVIIRFSRDNVDETDNARELIQNMNRQVIWHNKGIDITETILKHLNSRYAPATATPDGNPTK